MVMKKLTCLMLAFAVIVMESACGGGGASTFKASSSAMSQSTRKVESSSWMSTSSSNSLSSALSVPAASSLVNSSAKTSSSRAMISSSALSSSSLASVSLSSNYSLDGAPPTMPLIILSQAVPTSVVITWTGATDNIAVTQYRVYKNQILLATFTAGESSFTDTSILPSQMYTYGLSAGDAANNWSGIRTGIITTMTASASSASSSSLSSLSSSKNAASSLASSLSSSILNTSSVASSSKSSASAVSSSASSLSNSNTAYLKWAPPVQRENGSVLDITELGGYELRYRLATDNTYTYKTINDPFTTEYIYNGSPLNMIFQIAAFDANGLYSNFVELLPK